MTRCTPVITHNKHIFTPPTLAGLFFCLASAEDAGLLFCPAAIQPHISVYSAFCVVNAVYTVHTTKQRAGLYRGVSCNCTHSTARDTRPTHAAIIPPVPRWSVSQRRNASSIYQIPTPRRTLYSSAQPPYYNKVYKGQRCTPVMDPCQTVQHIADHASPAAVSILPTPGGLQSGTGSVWHPPPGGAVWQQGRGGRRGTIGGSRRISFRAFAR